MGSQELDQSMMESRFKTQASSQSAVDFEKVTYAEWASVSSSGKWGWGVSLLTQRLWARPDIAFPGHSGILAQEHGAENGKENCMVWRWEGGNQNVSLPARRSKNHCV